MRRRFLGLFLGLTLLAAAFGAPVSAQDDVQQLEPQSSTPTAETVAPLDESTQLWFVQLASPPAADGTSTATLKAERDSFRRAAARAGVTFTERMEFEMLFNGLSVQIRPSQLNGLSRVSGVKALWPVVTLSLPEAQASVSPDLATALNMTGAATVQSELGYDGTGIKVAVMDTGVDYHHPDLGGCFGPGCRVVTGWDFVGSAFNADPTSPAYNPVPVPDPDPDDCNGHGTHVAGIIGANGETRGVAPGVTLGAYRVFGCAGSTTADIMIAAMERALADGMHVLNMSIGSAFQWPQYPTAMASNRLVNKGMVVVASIGNSGANGLYSAGSPGLGEKVIGVASFDNSHVSALTFKLPDGTLVPYMKLSVTQDPPTSGTTPEIVYVGQGCNADSYLADPNGKVALIVRGACTFAEKYQRAFNAGAVGVVIHNNVAGLFAGGGVLDKGIFGVGISLADGLKIRGMANPTLEWTNQRLNAPNPTGGLISSFSSYGLSPDLALKPDIGAPGGLIRAPYPLELGGYAILSGTSMSSPHVAGTVALLLQALPNTPAQAVRGILQSTALPRPWWGNPGLGFLDNVHRQGAGMVNIARALAATAKVEPSKLSLGESEAGPAARRLMIENNSAAAVTYTPVHRPALSTGPTTFSPSFFTGFASVSFSAPSITVPAGGTAAIDVIIAAHPGLPQGSQYGGYIELNGDNGQTLGVPYAGFKGDYQAIQVLKPTSFGFPWLARLAGGSYTKQSSGATYSMAGSDIPFLLVHLDHQVRRLRVEVKDAVSGANWHRALDLEYVGRNSTSTGFFALPFDGVTTGGNKTHTVPNGSYVLVISVQKALGDDNDPAHWESWTSPSFTIQRP